MRGIEGVTIVRPVQANAVFAILPADVTERLQKRFRFYTWDQATGEVRWMCSWDTTLDDVDAFADAIAEEMAATADRQRLLIGRPPGGPVGRPALPRPHDLLVHDAPGGQRVEVTAGHLHRPGRRVDMHAGKVERALPRALGEPHGLRSRMRDDGQPAGDAAAAGREHRAVPRDREATPLDR